jgi:hypothetical protein
MFYDFCLNNVCNFLLFDFLGSFIPFLFKKSKHWISVNPIGKSPFYFSQKPFSYFLVRPLEILCLFMFNLLKYNKYWKVTRNRSLGIFMQL